MKWALLTDLHANLQAFEACLAHARSQGADRFALLGDLVGYGGDPATVLDMVMNMADAGAIVLLGNHDEMAMRPPPGDKTIGAISAPWTHAQLNATQLDFLASLPLTWRGNGLFLAHASADAPERWHYLDNASSATACLNAAKEWPEVRHLFFGHVHHQALYYRGRGKGLMRFAPTPGVAVPTPAHRHWLATVGSVGQPRDGDPRAMYALFDDSALALTFQRVAYDHQGAALAIRRAGLPDFFADRLELGR